MASSRIISPTIPSTMHAAVFIPGNTQLNVVTDYPVPKPAADEVLLKVKACGVCHSDVSLPFRVLTFQR
jgi:propanol-preferring alcohol dehydrogenase